jgi:peptidoglycan-associated lipoprotein
VARQNQQVALNANCEDGTFRTIYFDFDESTLTSAARADLEFNTKCFSARQGNATIQGHCDERGTEEYNLALGERRARAARKFLQDAGVSSSRMNVVSYGETRPADGRSSEDAWSRNRRAEFVWR